MRILNKQDFLKLPAGIIFRKAGPNSIAFGNLQIKAATLSDDFVSLELCDFNFDEYLDSSRETSLNFDSDGYGRDGCFDDKETFLVLEPIDIFKLKKILDGAIGYEN